MAPAKRPEGNGRDFAWDLGRCARGCRSASALSADLRRITPNRRRRPFASWLKVSFFPSHATRLSSPIYSTSSRGQLHILAPAPANDCSSTLRSGEGNLNPEVQLILLLLSQPSCWIWRWRGKKGRPRAVLTDRQGAGPVSLAVITVEAWHAIPMDLRDQKALGGARTLKRCTCRRVWLGVKGGASGSLPGHPAVFAEWNPCRQSNSLARCRSRPCI